VRPADRVAATVLLVAAAIVLVLLAAGCAQGPMTDGGKGTIVAHSKNRRKCSIRSCYTYKITTARDGSGTRETARVHEDVYNACQVGDRWPDCKDGAR
jgi:hypothetical protein